LRSALVIIWLVSIGVMPWASSDAAQQDIPSLTVDLHPWGKFDLGAWKRMRVVAETMNEQGAVTDSKTTLFDLDDESLSLETRTCVEMAGKRYESEPQIVKQGFHGEVISPNLKMKESTAGQVEIEERKIPCQVLKLESATNTGKTSITIYYSASVAPYILQRESKTTDVEGKNILSETTSTVLSLEMPYRIQDEMRTVSHIKTVQKSPNGSVIVLATLCSDIPGGVVSYSSKELDAGGKLVRRSALELIDYGSEPEKDRSSLFGRKRANRHRSH
jgi:hypothetical protein